MATLEVKRAVPTTSSRLTWKWVKGADTAFAEFGHPDGADTYAFCLFDVTGTAPALLFEAKVPAGGTCGTRPCWGKKGRVTAPTGWKYADKLRARDGVDSLELKAGVAGGF